MTYRYVCSGDGPATHTNCTFATNDYAGANTHFERTGHSVDAQPAIGDHVRHVSFGVTGTVTSFDDRFDVFVVTLDRPMTRIGDASLTTLTGTAHTLEILNDQ
jgi:hypothetical protein